MLSLFDLPDELLVIIITFLNDIHDLLRCKESCRYLCRLIESNVGVNLKMQLLIHGLIDGPRTGSLCSSLRLQRLNERAKAWDKFSWSSLDLWPTKDMEAWEIIGGYVGRVSSQGHFTFMRIPSVHRNITHEVWSFVVEFVVQDFTYDPKQDLLFIMERHAAMSHTIHFLRLSDSRPHPEASRSSLQVPGRSGDYARYFSDLRICGYHVAVMSYISIADTDVDDVELVIWNWKTGDNVFKMQYNSLESFTFLSEDVILVAQISGEYLTTPCLDIYDLRRRPCKPYCSLELPCTSSANLWLYSDPSTTVHWHSADVPFATSYADKIIILGYGIDIGDDEEVENPYAMFMPASRLLALIDYESDTTTPMNWKIWAPTTSRIIRYSLPDSWVSIAQGMRAVLYTPGNNYFLIVDFNPLVVQNYQVKDTALEVPSNELVIDCARAYNEPTTCVIDANVTIATQVPFKITPYTLPQGSAHDCESIMLSEDAIVIVPKDSPEFRIFAF